MTIGSLAGPWHRKSDDRKPDLPARKRLCAPAALLDAACLSLLLWLVILAVLR